MAGKSLDEVISESDGGDLTTALNEYFRTPPRPSESVVSDVALNILLKNVRQSPEFVPLVVQCLDDFMSNEKMQQEWLLYYKELSQLCGACFEDAKLFTAPLRVICGIISTLSAKGEPLSSALFNICAEKFLELIEHSTTESETLALSVLSNLCRFSLLDNISETFDVQASQIKKLATRSSFMAMEAQVSVYMILMKIISSKEDALVKAALWFHKSPKIQYTFVHYYPDNIAEGCEAFLNQLQDSPRVQERPVASTPISEGLSTTSVKVEHPHGTASTSLNAQEYNWDMSESELCTFVSTDSDSSEDRFKVTPKCYPGKLRQLSTEIPELEMTDPKLISLSLESDGSEDYFGTLDKTSGHFKTIPRCYPSKRSQRSESSELELQVPTVIKATPRFTLQQRPSSPLHHRQFHVGLIRKRGVYLDASGKWCLDMKYFPDITTKTRWRSFKRDN